jgi:hypothetical protein
MKRNVFALFGAVAVMFIATTALTLSRGTPFATGIGTLKCYDGAIESNSSGVAKPNASKISPETRSIGRWSTTCDKEVISLPVPSSPHV